MVHHRLKLEKAYSLFSIIPKSLEELKPRFLITDGAFCKLGIWQDPWFKSNYRVVKFFPHQLWSDGIYLYELKQDESSTDSSAQMNLDKSTNTKEEKEIEITKP